jgi:sulfate adenylyltransferase
MLHDTVIMSAASVPPYGGVLVSPVLPPAHAAERLRTLTAAPSWDLTPSQIVDLELLLTGALSPLRGFMTRDHAERSRTEGRLADGTRWPAPVVLEVSADLAATLGPRTPLVLRDLEGVPLAVLSVEEVWSAPADGAGGSDAWCIGGIVEGLRLPIHHDFVRLRPTPAAMRAEIARRGWTRTVGLPIAGALSDELVRQALHVANRLDAGLLVVALLPASGLVAADHFERVRAVRAAFGAFPADRAQLLVLPWNRFEPIARDRLLRAIVARNLGCTHVAQPAGADTSAIDEIGIAAVGIDAAIETPDVAASQAGLSSRRGLTIFLTGLSGSGKSTIANILRVKLLEHSSRRVSLLDGDLVRKHLSSELGFSREHRELNVRRIAYVASEITLHGGIAICAPIAPYDAVRRDARRMIEAVGDFVLVFVDTPLTVCEGRDPKGLYAKARAGLLPSFTGVSDPYERPEDAEIVLDTTDLSAAEAADRVMAALTARGSL